MKHVDDVAELPRALLELARQEHRGGGDPPHVELDHGSLGEAVEEDLAGARHLLRRLRSTAASRMSSHPWTRMANSSSSLTPRSRLGEFMILSSVT